MSDDPLAHYRRNDTAREVPEAINHRIAERVAAALGEETPAPDLRRPEGLDMAPGSTVGTPGRSYGTRRVVAGAAAIAIVAAGAWTLGSLGRSADQPTSTVAVGEPNEQDPAPLTAPTPTTAPRDGFEQLELYVAAIGRYCNDIGTLADTLSWADEELLRSWPLIVEQNGELSSVLAAAVAQLPEASDHPDARVLHQDHSERLDALKSQVNGQREVLVRGAWETVADRPPMQLAELRASLDTFVSLGADSCRLRGR